MDDRETDGEQRWQTFGYIDGQLFLMVANTVPEGFYDGGAFDVIRLITARRATPKERRDYETKMVSYTMETLPRMTDERAAGIKAMIDSPDYEINFSDIPELTEEQLKNAVRGRFYRPVKKSPPASTPT